MNQNDPTAHHDGGPFGTYVSVKNLHRRIPPRSGQSTTHAVPSFRATKPVFVRFTHGFRFVRPGLVTVDLPSAMQVIDARSGELLEELHIGGTKGEVPADDKLSTAAMARLGTAVDALAPAFFEDAQTIPPSLAAVAAQYREDVPRALHPDFLPFYRKHAAQWCQWVGL